MRYNEFITEKKKPSYTELDPDDWKEIVKRDCKPFLTARGNAGDIYRGMGAKITKQGTFTPGVPAATKPDFFKGKVRLDNRAPMTTTKIQHTMMNDYFQRTFGAPYRNSLHVTGDLGFAEQFGNSYAIFPIGDFTFLWSTLIKDFDSDLLPHPSLWRRIVPAYKRQDQQEVDLNLSKFDYRTDDLQSAIKSGNEIMIRCNEYYAVRKRFD